MFFLFSSAEQTQAVAAVVFSYSIQEGSTVDIPQAFPNGTKTLELRSTTGQWNKLIIDQLENILSQPGLESLEKIRLINVRSLTENQIKELSEKLWQHSKTVQEIVWGDYSWKRDKPLLMSAQEKSLPISG
ncbi:MAG: hypothetical protein H6850_01465 [Alphaproteobacteria bacterium]|nr:MAG: hypothetical protein H6850_01465 [Alphaproteobacteria bacterium]